MPRAEEIEIGIHPNPVDPRENSHSEKNRIEIRIAMEKERLPQGNNRKISQKKNPGKRNQIRNPGNGLKLNQKSEIMIGIGIEEDRLANRIRGPIRDEDRHRNIGLFRVHPRDMRIIGEAITGSITITAGGITRFLAVISIATAIIVAGGL